MKYINWYEEESELETTDGKKIQVLHLNYIDEEDALNEWAEHFRKNYRSIEDIDYMNDEKELRSEYLINHVFPEEAGNRFGPATRVGDFSELLVADYIEYVLDYMVPRTRYDRKTNRNESTQGTDLIGYKMGDKPRKTDEVQLVEIKGTSDPKSKKQGYERLQDAINDSKKDIIRYAESIEASILRLKDRNCIREAVKLKRFMNIVDYPYIIKYGAAAVLTDEKFIPGDMIKTDASFYREDSVKLIVIHTRNLKWLISEIYRRAAKNADWQ